MASPTTVGTMYQSSEPVDPAVTECPPIPDTSALSSAVRLGDAAATMTAIDDLLAQERVHTNTHPHPFSAVPQPLSVVCRAWVQHPRGGTRSRMHMR